MLKHIVLFKLKENAKGASWAQTVRTFGVCLLERIPFLICWKWFMQQKGLDPNSLTPAFTFRDGHPPPALQAIRSSLLCLACAAFLTGCAGYYNPYGVPESEAATIQNRWEQRENYGLSLMFTAAKPATIETRQKRTDEALSWLFEPDDLVNFEYRRGGTTRGVDAVYRLPAGTWFLRLIIVQRTSTSIFSMAPALKAYIQVEAKFERGAVYVVEADIAGDTVRAWVKDKTTNVRVSNVEKGRLTRFP
jgi:hypothetical protein